MANNYKRRAGDRVDGRRLRSLNGFYNFIPFIMPARNDALNYYEESFEITNADRWFRKQRVAGYKGMGMLHLLIAAYVRACAYLPGLNRFCVGKRIYARDEYRDRHGRKAQPDHRFERDYHQGNVFKPTDTIYDVYSRMNAAIDEIKNSDEENGTGGICKQVCFPAALRHQLCHLASARRRRFRPAAGRSSWMLSPLHGSMAITDLGSLGIGPDLSSHLQLRHAAGVRIRSAQSAMCTSLTATATLSTASMSTASSFLTSARSTATTTQACSRS